MFQAIFWFGVVFAVGQSDELKISILKNNAGRGGEVKNERLYEVLKSRIVAIAETLRPQGWPTKKVLGNVMEELAHKEVGKLPDGPNRPNPPVAATILGWLKPSIEQGIIFLSESSASDSTPFGRTC